MEHLKELQEFLEIREIFITPWGKTGKENMRDLELYHPKPKKLSPAQKYFLKKAELEKQVNQHPHKANLNICYICLVFFEKTTKRIKSHLNGKPHQKNWKTYQAHKLKNFPQNGLLSGNQG